MKNSDDNISLRTEGVDRSAHNLAKKVSDNPDEYEENVRYATRYFRLRQHGWPDRFKYLGHLINGTGITEGIETTEDLAERLPGVSNSEVKGLKETLNTGEFEELNSLR